MRGLGEEEGEEEELVLVCSRREEKPCSTSPVPESKTEAEDSAAAAETPRGVLCSTPRAYNSMDSTDADVREAAPESDDWSDGIATSLFPISRRIFDAAETSAT